MLRPRAIWNIMKWAASDWMADKAQRLGAAVAFYSVLSLAPLLIIAIAVAGLVFGEDAARGQIVGELGGMVGKEGSEAIQSMIANARKPESGILAAAIGIATLLFGATGVFGELQDSMNTIWNVEPKADGGIWGFVKSRFLSFAMVFGIAFLLLVSLVVSAILSAAGKYFAGAVPYAALMQLVNSTVSFIVIMVLFAMMFRFLPDTKVNWGDVWVGAAITAVLFTLGKYLIGLYLGQSGIGSAYGAAGSLVALLIWIYYSAQIFFFGAEITQVFANRCGSHLGGCDDSDPAPPPEPGPPAREPQVGPAGGPLARRRRANRRA